MNKPIDARIQKSHNALMEAGLRLLNQNKEASLSDIASAAGVGRATLYRLFSNKDELVKAIALHCLELFDQATTPLESKARSVMHFMELLFETIMPMTDEFQFLMDLDYFADDIPEVEEIANQIDKEMIELFDEGKREGSISKDLPSTWLNSYTEGLFISGWLQQKEHGADAKECARLAFRCFKNGVK